MYWGGYWGNEALHCRAARRGPGSPGSSNDDKGFRCARGSEDAPPPPADTDLAHHYRLDGNGADAAPGGADASVVGAVATAEIGELAR